MPVRLECQRDRVDIARAAGLSQLEELTHSTSHQPAVATGLRAKLGIEQVSPQKHQVRCDQSAGTKRPCQVDEPLHEPGFDIFARIGHGAHLSGQALVRAPDRAFDELAFAAETLNQRRWGEPHPLTEVGQREAARPPFTDQSNHHIEQLHVGNQLVARHVLNINDHSFIIKCMSKVRVYIASSFDGFIAGPGDDLSWLPGADPTASEGVLDGPTHSQGSGSVGYAEFMERVGALLMGRRTFDVVLGFGGEWPYAERPVLVATHRPLATDIPSVEPVSGSIEQLIAHAKHRAGNKDVYLDGGNLIRQALDAGLVDDLIVTLVPELLGQGHPLFAGLEQRRSLEFTGHYPFGPGLLQIHARPRQ